MLPLAGHDPDRPVRPQPQRATNEAPKGGWDKFFNSGLEKDTLAVWLRRGGYVPALVGKYLNGYPSDGSTTIPPMSRPAGPTGLRSPTTPSTRCTATTSTRTGAVVSYGEEPADYQTDVLADKADEFLRASLDSGDPFFLQVAPAGATRRGCPRGARTCLRNPRPAPRHDGRFESAELPRWPVVQRAGRRRQAALLRATTLS